jgi:hypothetical protein
LQRHKGGDLLGELVHVIVEAETSQGLPSSNCRTKQSLENKDEGGEGGRNGMDRGMLAYILELNALRARSSAIQGENDVPTQEVREYPCILYVFALLWFE